VSEPLAHLYALALRALDDQERRADALRGRLGPVLAAAALGTSLLSGPAVGGTSPGSLAGTLAAVLTIGGLVATPAAAAYVMGRRSRTTAFYETMISQLNSHRLRNVGAIDLLERAFTAMLCGILVMLCGLATATIVG